MMAQKTAPQSPWIFDSEHHQRLIESRGGLMRRLLPELQHRLVLRTAIDVGCGAGHFSGLLHELGFEVTALDGRPENVAEAARRNPAVRFHAADVEDASLSRFGRFDLVLCFGLLYHLENPFRAIRNLFGLTRSVLVMESMCIPGEQPVLDLRDECHGEDQSLHYVAFYPSEPALVKMLYRAGYAHVYTLGELPDHAEFHASPRKHKTRTMLMASGEPLDFSFLIPAPEPATAAEPWTTWREKFWSPARRIARAIRRRLA
jgi:SAM-dependent methyltransferase